MRFSTASLAIGEASCHGTIKNCFYQRSGRDFIDLKLLRTFFIYKIVYLSIIVISIKSIVEAKLLMIEILCQVDLGLGLVHYTDV